MAVNASSAKPEEVKKLLDAVAKVEGVVDTDKTISWWSNIFRLCGIERNERVHSRVIAEFLNPSGMHGMLDKPLGCFFDLENVKSHLSSVKFSEDVKGLDQALVVTEERFTDESGKVIGLCDIAIHWRNWCIVIENKIDAQDQPLQLRRYWNAISRNGEVPVLFYLTLDGHPASEDSGGTVHYQCLSYKNDILTWIDNIKKLGGACVGDILVQYRELVETIAGDGKMSNKIVELIKATRESFMSASAISKEMADARRSVVKEVVQSLERKMEDEQSVCSHWGLKKEKGCIISEDESRMRFSFQYKSDEVPYRVCCEFQTMGTFNELFIGLEKRERGKTLALEKAIICAFEGKFGKNERENVGKWIYVAPPRGCHSELRTWDDCTLARLTDKAYQQEFVEKLMTYLESFLTVEKDARTKNQGR